VDQFARARVNSKWRRGQNGAALVEFVIVAADVRRGASHFPPPPYLSSPFVCAFIANAASFALPISNPANLVIFGAHMPPLAAWLGQFALASVAAIGMTYAALRFTQHDALKREVIAQRVLRPQLSQGGRLTACGIGTMAVALLCCSALNVQLGWPTFICGVMTAVIVLALNRQPP
jgi:arsenical pump membrane protein